MLQDGAESANRRATTSGCQKPLDQPPQDAESERLLVGCALLDPASVLPHVLTNDLFTPAHQFIIHAMLALRADGATIDKAAIAAKLREQGTLKKAGGTKYLAELHRTAPDAAEWQCYRDQVADLARRRKLWESGSQLRRAAHNGKTVDAAVTEARDALEEIGRAETEPRFKPMTSHQLDSGDFRLSYAINGVLVERQPCVIAGPPKSLKTSLMVDMAIALAIGGCFLGRFHVARAYRVLVMSGESGLETLQETARKICAVAGKDIFLTDLENLFWERKLPRLDDQSDLAALRELLHTTGMEVLICDPLYLMIPGDDAGNLFKQGRYLRAIGEVCEQLGVTLVMLHHTGKRAGGAATGFEPPELADMAWSGPAEWARQWLLIGRREKYDPESGLHRLWLNMGGSAGHSGGWAVDVDEGTDHQIWGIEVVPASQARAEATERDAEAKAEKKERMAAAALEIDIRKTIRAMQAMPEGETQSVIGNRAGIGGKRAGIVLAAMVDQGLVTECTITKGNKQKYSGYQLATQTLRESHSDNSSD